MQLALLWLPTAVSWGVQLQRQLQAGMEQRYHFRLYRRANLSSPGRTGSDGLSLDILELTGSRCNCQGSDLGCTAHQLICTPLPLPWDDRQRLLLLVLQEHILAAGQSKPQQLQVQVLTAGKRQITLIHLQGLMCRRRQPGKKSWHIFSMHHSKAGVRSRQKHHLSPREHGTHTGMTKCSRWSYPDNILRNYFFTQLLPQHFIITCLDSFTVPPLFHLPKQRQENNQSKEADGFSKNRLSFTLNNSCRQ